jgi:osmoprotectant transport system substrate-binding protein
MARAQVLAGLTLAALAAACGGRGHGPTLVVGSKNFTEQTILGEIAAQQLERRLGKPVARRLDLGGTLLAHEALVAGRIDLYPEYTGTALTAILKQPISADPKAVFDAVARDYETRWKLRWTRPLGFDDTFAMVIRGADARSEKIRTMSQAAARAAPWRLGVGYEFVERPDGLPGLRKAYALRLSGPPRMMDLGILYKALESKEVDMVAANATDGLLSVLDVTVLKDDRRFFPPYEAAFVVREECLTRDPRVGAALEELSGKLTSDEMRRLNHDVAGGHRRVAEVAKDFLDGLTTAPASTPRAP